MASFNKKVNSLHSFNRFLIENGVLTRVVVHPAKDRIRIALGSEREVEVFTEKEVARILSHVSDPKRVSLRNRLIIHLLLYTGVRVCELVSIRLSEIDLLTSTLRVTGKGGKYREVPLRPDLAELIREYVATERQESRFRDSPYLLLSQRSPRMHRDAVNRLVRRIGRELGIAAYPHKFRHIFCILLLRKGVPITIVSRLAGHSSIQTTSTVYVGISRREKMETVNLL